jgi:hypothetical protein
VDEGDAEPLPAEETEEGRLLSAGEDLFWIDVRRLFAILGVECHPILLGAEPEFAGPALSEVRT